MSRDSEDFPVQPEDEADELANDPEHHLWCIVLEAQSDYEKRIPLSEVMKKLRGRGASQAEVETFLNAFNAECLRAIARDSGIGDPGNPYVFVAARIN